MKKKIQQHRNSLSQGDMFDSQHSAAIGLRCEMKAVGRRLLRRGSSETYLDLNLDRHG